MASELPPPPPSTAATATATATATTTSSLSSSLAASVAKVSVSLDAPSTAATVKSGAQMSFDFQPFSGTTSTLQTATTADGSDDDSSYEPQPGDNNLAGMEMDIPKCVLHRISHLSQLHDKKGDIMEAYMAERAALEAKYMSLCSPLYEERRQVVVGELDSTIEEAAKRGVYPSSALDDKEEGATGLSANDDENTDGSKIVGCPQFWLVAMGHMDVISDVITEGDVDALEYIYDIKCLDKPDGTGFTIEFYFNSKTNPYFSNEKLTKTYSIPNLYMEDEPIIDDVKGCEIHWLDEEHCLTERSVTKKERSKGGKRKGQVRTITTKERVDSFFWFFTPPKMPDVDEDMEEEEAEAMEEAFDMDYDVAQAFRTHLCRDAILWFTGEAANDEEEDSDEEGEEDEEEEEEDEGGAEEDGEGDKVGPAKPLFPTSAAPEGEQPECKNS
ncbi:hypothetical protein ScalyP_jg6866 [Parmales sp. scaly parma]|nr:hypothetical protein ScalyP_jg6866 [Parmales sp. scaly parma]